MAWGGPGSPAASLGEESERWRGPGRLAAHAQDVDAQQESQGQRGQHQPPGQRHRPYGDLRRPEPALRSACRRRRRVKMLSTTTPPPLVLIFPSGGVGGRWGDLISPQQDLGFLRRVTSQNNPFIMKLWLLPFLKFTSPWEQTRTFKLTFF